MSCFSTLSGSRERADDGHPEQILADISRKMASRARPEFMRATMRPVREVLIDKLRPDRFTGMSGKMAAIVGYILDQRFSDPAISELVVTSDGFVLAQREGEVGANEMIGEETDLNRNLLTLIDAAGLTEDEVREFGRLQRGRIRRY